MTHQCVSVYAVENAPDDAQREPRDRSARGERTQGQGATVLVVDDVQAVQVMTRHTLERAGYVVMVASNGHEAIRLLRAVSVDLVLLDMRMPVMDGEEFLAVRAQDDTLRRIRVLVHSSESKPPVRWGEVSGHVLKPANDDELLASVARALAR